MDLPASRHCIVPRIKPFAIPLMVLTFIITGLLTCTVLACFYFSLYWLFDCKTTYRRMQYYIAYPLFAQFIFLTDWWTNSSLTLVGRRSELQQLGTEHALNTMNHRYEIDWLVGWMICDRFSMLGSVKFFGKRSIQYIPILGWMFKMCEAVFLSRKYDEDQMLLQHSIKSLARSPYPTMLCLMAEGTRFTAEKHAQSVEFSKKHDLPALQYHLQPRTRGFVQIIRGMQDSSGAIRAIYDTTIAIDPWKSKRPTFFGILKGIPFYSEVYFRRYDVLRSVAEGGLKEADGEATAKWLYTLYKEKDDLLVDFMQNGGAFVTEKHADIIRISPPRRLLPLITTIITILVTIALLVKFSYCMLTTFSALQLLTFVSAIAMTAALIFYILIRVTKIEKSSKYGKR